MDIDFPEKFTRIVSSRYQIECCAFSPSGDILAACFSNGSVRFYRISLSECGSMNAELAHHFNEHTSNAWCISFSGDGLLLSSCSSDYRVIIYSVSTFSVKHVLEIHSDIVWCCKFNSSSRHPPILATGSSDCSVKVTDPVSGKVMHTLTGFKSGVESLSFDNSGENLCTAFMDGSIIVWMDIHNSSSLPVGLLVHSEIVRLCRFISLDSNKFILISSSHYHSLTLLDIRESMSLLHSEEIPLENVIVRDVKSSVKRVQQFDGHCNFVWSVCCLESKSLSKTKAVLVSCSSDKTIRYL